MELDEKDNLRENLLPRNKRGSEDGERDFQSCKSSHSGDEEDKEDYKNNRISGARENGDGRDNQSIQNDHLDHPTKQQLFDSDEKDDSESPEPPSIKIQSENQKKSQAKTIWREIVDFLVFCYEFLLIMGLIAASSILPAIPNSIYVFLSILYLGLHIIIQKQKTNLAICTTITGLLLAISIVFVIFKIIFTILIYYNSVKYQKNLYVGLGIAVKPDDIDFFKIVKTFLSDVVSLVVSILLFVGWILKRKNNEIELEEGDIESLKITGSRSPKLWIWVCIFFITLAGIISPSIIALSFSVFWFVGLYSWALHFELHGPIMNIIAYLSVAIAALYINASFIIQIELFERVQGKNVLNWLGLDNFDKGNKHLAENIAGYAITVLVYIVCLIYHKASSRYRIKMKYLVENGKLKLKHQVTKGFRARKFKKKHESTWQSLKKQIIHLLKNPYAHLLFFRFCLFGWIFLYFTFQSLVPLFFLCHSVIYFNKDLFMSFIKFLYLPLMWLTFFFNYVINIDGLFSKSIFKESNRRYGFFDYHPPFIHLLYQVFTLFYWCFTLYLFREYDKRMEKVRLYKERQEAKRKAKLERQSENSSVYRGSAGASSFAGESVMAELSQETTTYTYEIIMRYLLKHIDILLMVVLYWAGVNRVDVYHVFLLILFVIYIMYPMQFRNNFVLLLYFMIFIATIKYFYVLFLPEFEARNTLNDIFDVLGFSTDIQKGNKYGKSNLFNNNYLIVFTGFIQYRLYTSEYSKRAFSEEQARIDAQTFGSRFPRFTAWMTVMIELFQLSIPWITYVVFIAIAILNTKSIINWILFTTTLVLLFWHITADLVTMKSHVRLKKGWSVFTFIAAICFLAILLFQILSMEALANWSLIDDVVSWLPNWVVDNKKMIGFEDYTDFTRFDLFVKFLAYVAYFNLSVITRRQFIRSSINVSNYEQKRKESLIEVIPNIRESEQEFSNSKKDEDDKLEVKFSLVFIIYKLKKLWPVFDTFSWHTFTVLSFAIIILAFHWKLSWASMWFIAWILLCYCWMGFKLQPNLKLSKIQDNSTVSAQELRRLWEEEDKVAKEKMISIRNYAVFLVSVSWVVFLSVLHLSANLQYLRGRYPEDKEFWNRLVFYTFFGGFNYNKQFNGNTYFQETFGFLLILALCALERKAQVWLANKLGFEGSVYDTFEGKIILHIYGKDAKSKEAFLETKRSTGKLEEIKEEDEDEYVSDEDEKFSEKPEKRLMKKLISSGQVNGGPYSEPDLEELEEQTQIQKEFDKEKKDKVKSLITMEYTL